MAKVHGRKVDQVSTQTTTPETTLWIRNMAMESLHGLLETDIKEITLMTNDMGTVK